jgi:L-ascorbate metabolism protein UlaG (beta-lactamase superfamily)
MGTLRIRYLGGPTALLEYGPLRLLVDPTFDPAGEYPVGERVLRKTADAVVGPDEVGDLDAVLLSHDQHPDNLDSGGRAFLDRVPVVFSTAAAAERLGSAVRGFDPWQSTALGPATVTAVPALHGPEGSEPYVGPVIGFVLTGAGLPSVYVSGDNASLDVVRQVADRFAPIDVAVLFAGAARTPLLDGAPLTLTSLWAAEAATILGAADVVPVHFEDWAHFSEGRETLPPAFRTAGVEDRLHLLERGEWWTAPIVPDVGTS